MDDLPQGCIPITKRMNFWKNVLIQKFMLQIFAIIKGYFGHEFWKKSATWFSENEGGSKAVWNFSENSSVLGGGCFPYGNRFLGSIFPIFFFCLENSFWILQPKWREDPFLGLTSIFLFRSFLNFFSSFRVFFRVL